MIFKTETCPLDILRNNLLHELKLKTYTKLENFIIPDRNLNFSKNKILQAKVFINKGSRWLNTQYFELPTTKKKRNNLKSS